MRMGNRRLADSQSRRDSLGHLACVVGLVIIVLIVVIVPIVTKAVENVSEVGCHSRKHDTTIRHEP